MAKKIIIGLLSILLLVGSNVGTWFAKDIYNSYYMHPIERIFNKIDYKNRLVIMKAGIEAVIEMEKRKQKKNSIKI